MELQNYLLDPNLIQKEGLSKLEQALDSKLDITDPTNPFMFLLENNANVAAETLQGYAALLKRMYPNLAKVPKDLFPHFNQDALVDIYSIPSSAIFNIVINVNDFMKNTTLENGYNKSIIPKYSYITVDDTYTFTLLNDVDIKYYPNSKKVIAKLKGEQNLKISESENTYLETHFFKDENNNEWIVIRLPLKQLLRYKIVDTFVSSVAYKKTFTIEDYYNFAIIKTINPTTDTKIELEITHDDYNINPDIPTMIVRAFEHNVELELPVIYNIKGNVSDKFDIELFTTKGELDLPITNYDASKFVLTIVNEEDVADVFKISDVNHFISAYTNVTGGEKELDFTSLKNKIIDYTTGDNKIPITLEEIKEKTHRYGYRYRYTVDTIFKREFLINKPIININPNIIKDTNDYQDTVTIYKPDTNDTKIKFVNNDNSIIIEPYQIFEFKDNKLNILTKGEMDIIKNLPKIDMDSYNNRKLLFNFFKYILDNDDKLEYRIYDVSNPSIASTAAEYNNELLGTITVIKNRTIIRYDNKYEIEFVVDALTNILDFDIDDLYAELSVVLDNDREIKYKAKAELVDTTIKFSFTVNYDPYITKEDLIKIYSDYGEIKTAYIGNDFKARLKIYTTDPAAAKGTNFKIKDLEDKTAVAVLYEDESSLNFVTKIDTLFSNYYIEYTDRKFKTYEEDVYLTYKEDVYEMDTDGLPKLYPVYDENDNVVDYEVKVIHKKGDNVLDDNGQPIILHKKGDVIIDEQGNPIIDPVYGIEHKINIHFLEDIYLRTSNIEYAKYILQYYSELKEILEKEIPELNKQLLENTKFKYISDFNLSKVILNYNYSYLILDNFIKPTVVLYVDKENINFALTKQHRMSIIDKFEEYLVSNFKVSDLEKSIEEIMGEDVKSVKVELLENRDLRYVEYSEKSSRFIINKILKYDNNNLYVDADISILIVKI